MARFLLIHGACHGAWCWSWLENALHARGHETLAIDLPGHGTDPTPPADCTAAGYRDAILAALTPDMVLVGHSMAGMWLPLVLDRARPRAVVSLAAWLPRAGETTADQREAGEAEGLRDTTRVAEDGQSFTFAEDGLADLFYGQCPPEALALARAHLCPEPMPPARTPLAVDPPSPDTLPWHYIRCLRDRAIPGDWQVRATAGWPAGQVHTLDTDHSPFFSCPAALADILSGIGSGSGG